MEDCICFKFLCAFLCPHCAHWPLCWWEFGLSNTYPLAVPSMPCLLFERGKEEREKAGHQKVVCADGLASVEALSSWKMLCMISWTTLKLEDALHTWAPSPSGHLRQSHLLLASSLCWVDFTKCRRRNRIPPHYLAVRRKKMPSFSEISYCLVPSKKRFFYKTSISRTSLH